MEYIEVNYHHNNIQEPKIHPTCLSYLQMPYFETITLLFNCHAYLILYIHQDMSYVAQVSGLLALFFICLWKYYLQPRKLLQGYKEVIQKEGYIVAQLTPSLNMKSETKSVISFEESSRDQLQGNADVALAEISGNVCVTILNSNLIKEFLDNIKSKNENALIEDQLELKNTNYHQGGLSAVEMDKIITYVSFLQSVGGENPWTESMTKLKDLIYYDPVLRLNWEQGIKHSTKILPNKTGIQVLAMINNVIYTPPSFQNCSVIGVPINAILLEFMQTENGRIFFSHSKVNEIFKQILNEYGKMLQSSASLKYMNTSSPKGWFSKEAHQKVDYSIYKCDPQHENYGFACWNDWFLRDFKDGVRKIGAGSPKNVHPDNVIVNACESTPLSQPLQPQRNVKTFDQFWLKDSKYSLNDMFGQVGNSKNYGSLFQGGTVYQAFLSALYYHHWHAPVNGTIQDIYSIQGTYFLDNSQNLAQFDIESPVQSQSFLSATAARMVMIIKADNPLIGYIGLIFIGMVEVSTCVSVVKIGQKVKKGDRLGHFMFGGSSHTMLFQKHLNLTFADGQYEPSVPCKRATGKIQLMGSYLAHIDP